MSDGIFLVGEVRSVKVRGAYSSCRVLANDNFVNVSVKGELSEGRYEFSLALPKIVEYNDSTFISYYAFAYEALDGGEK